MRAKFTQLKVSEMSDREVTGSIPWTSRINLGIENEGATFLCSEIKNKKTQINITVVYTFYFLPNHHHYNYVAAKERWDAHLQIHSAQNGVLKSGCILLALSVNWNNMNTVFSTVRFWRNSRNLKGTPVLWLWLIWWIAWRHVICIIWGQTHNL